MTIKILSTLAVAGPLERHLIPRLARLGVDVEVGFDPTAVLQQRLLKGESFDIVIAVEGWIQELSASRQIDQATVRRIGSVGIGLAVAQNAPLSLIGTLDDVRRLVTSARSVALSRSGASGKVFFRALDALGVRAEVERDATILEKGFTADAIVDGRADVAVQQVSELHYVTGVQVLGPLPKGLQTMTAFAIGARVESRQVMAVIDWLTDEIARESYAKSGLVMD